MLVTFFFYLYAFKQILVSFIICKTKVRLVQTFFLTLALNKKRL